MKIVMQLILKEEKLNDLRNFMNRIFMESVIYDKSHKKAGLFFTTLYLQIVFLKKPHAEGQKILTLADIS